ncbi:tetratricopeptide repeat protein [Candidatus Woesearchaeota archaeon]|nr:tetratricopeptide repeat protein [Candidatus Woesearchaeota archaeon]
MNSGYSIKDNVIIIDRELTELDLFVRKFLNILTRYSDYLIVSGFVSISTGRSRSTEDIDIIAPIMNKEKFKKLFGNLVKNNFWCYNSDDYEEAYEYFKNVNSIRFAEKGELFPNIEFVPFDSKKRAKNFEFNNPQIIKIKDFEFKIPPIEFEILYKELILKSKKDIEDARHLRVFFSDFIKKEKFIKYKPIILSDLK